MTVSDNKVVSITYRIANEAGEVLDTNEEFDADDYLHGHHYILPAFENIVDGMEIEQEKTVLLEPEQAYGTYRPELLMNIERAQMDAQNLQRGDVLESNGKEFIVAEVNEDTITVNGNHPLAGQRLIFWVKVLGIRDATAEELQNGIRQPTKQGGCGADCCC